MINCSSVFLPLTGKVITLQIIVLEEKPNVDERYGQFFFSFYSHEIFREICFVELNLSWCCSFVDLMRCGSISRIWSSDHFLIWCLRLIWGSWARDILEVGVLKESLYLQKIFNLRGNLESWKACRSWSFERKIVSSRMVDFRSLLRMVDFKSLVALGRIIIFWSKIF